MVFNTQNTHTHKRVLCNNTESLKWMDQLKLHIPHAHTYTVAQWHPSSPLWCLSMRSHPTCNQVKQWLSEIALATLSWVWWETGLILWWIPALPRFRQGENERVMPSLTHSNASWDKCVSVCIRKCERGQDQEIQTDEQRNSHNP